MGEPQLHATMLCMHTWTSFGRHGTTMCYLIGGGVHRYGNLGIVFLVTWIGTKPLPICIRTASQNAPPATAPDSQGDNGGGSSNYEDLRGYALWAISYGIASAIALRTIDALTSSRSTGGHEIAQQKKEKEKTSSGNSNPPPSICHIVFPSVTLINPTTTTSPDPKEETAAASASPNPKPAAGAGNVSTTTTTTDTSKGAKETAASASPKPPAAGEKETVGAAINRTIGSFFSQLQVENHPPPPPQANKEDHDRALAKAQAITTNTCKHVIDFYNDCLGGGSWNKCDSYVDIMKKCHQMESHSPAASPQESQAGSSIPSSMIPPHPGRVAHARDRVQTHQAYFQQPSNSPAISAPVSRRSSNHRGMAQVGPVAASSSDQTSAKESSDIVILDDSFPSVTTVLSSANNSDDVSAAPPPIPTLRLSINLLLMSYHGKNNIRRMSAQSILNISRKLITTNVRIGYPIIHPPLL
ncbi:unnamed protein product [Camellia sinensis]